MVFGETLTYTNTVRGLLVSYKQRDMGAGGRGTQIWHVPLAESASTQGCSYGAMGRQTREGGSSQKPYRNPSNQPRKVPARGWPHRERGSARRTRGAAARRRRYPIPPITPLLAMHFLSRSTEKLSAPALERLSAAARVCGVSSTTPPPMCRIALRCRHAAAPPPPLQRPSSVVAALPHENARARARGGDGCGGRLRRHRHRDVSSRSPS